MDCCCHRAHTARSTWHRTCRLGKGVSGAGEGCHEVHRQTQGRHRPSRSPIISGPAPPFPATAFACPASRPCSLPLPLTLPLHPGPPPPPPPPPASRSTGYPASLPPLLDAPPHLWLLLNQLPGLCQQLQQPVQRTEGRRPLGCPLLGASRWAHCGQFPGGSRRGPDGGDSDGTWTRVGEWGEGSEGGSVRGWQ